MSDNENFDGAGWWICGPAEYTIPALPPRAPKDKGFVYGLLLSSGLVKIGRSGIPRRRIAAFAGVVRRYGQTDVRAVGLSHPSANYKEIEAQLHQSFADRHANGELYRCSLSEVAKVIVGQQLIVPNLGINRPGRRTKPWYWEARKGWYGIVNGSRLRLGNDEETAAIRLREIKARGI